MIIEDGEEFDFEGVHNQQEGIAEEDEDSGNDLDTLNDSYKNWEKPPCIVQVYESHEAEVVSLSTNPANKNEFVSGGMDDKVYLWNVDKDKPNQSISFDETVTFVSFGFDGKLLASACLDNKISIFERDNDNCFNKKYEFSEDLEEVTVA